MLEWLRAFDSALFHLLNGSFHWAPIDVLFYTASEVKHFYLLLLLVLALLIWKGGVKGRVAAILCVTALTVSDQVASHAIKPLVDRPRPCAVEPGAVVLGGCGEGKSFPSTHASDSVAVVTVLLAFFPKRKWWLVALAAVIGYSRIHLGAHYPLDVLAGALLGYGVGKVLLLARGWMEARLTAAEQRGRGGAVAWVGQAFRRAYGLPVLSGILLGMAYPPFRYGGILAAVGVVPLLFAIERLQGMGKWRLFKAFFVALVVWQALSNYWIGGWSAEADPFLMMACVALVFVHPFFLMVPLVGYSWVRSRFGLRSALGALPFLWTAFEYLHSIGDLGYPWLTLGNTQTYYTEGIQFISATGVYGASFVLLAINVMVFALISAWRRREGLTVPSRALAWGIVACVALPAIHASWVFREHDLHPAITPHARIAVLQPNIDPWMKWNGMDERAQVEKLMAMSRAALASHPDIVLWPETAVPFYLISSSHYEDIVALHRFVDSTRIALLTGVPHYEITRPGVRHPADARILEDGSAYAPYNATMMMLPGTSRLQFYHKMQLVPLGERTPFVDAVPMLAGLVKWSVGLSGWSKGMDSVLLASPIASGDSARVYAMICYESVYPSLVRSFVARGANVMTIVTNDGWYGRTAGPIQHQQFAVLRAIENRRAIARSANTGISCFIDEYGSVDQRTRWYEEASIVGEIPLIETQSFYTRYGDWFAMLCLGVSAMTLLAVGVQRMRKKGMESKR
jgi:apolipoprotein N-acyltransferase